MEFQCLNNTQHGLIQQEMWVLLSVLWQQTFGHLRPTQVGWPKVSPDWLFQMPLELIVLPKRHIYTLRSPYQLFAFCSAKARWNQIKTQVIRGSMSHTAFHSRCRPVNKSVGIRGDASECLLTMQVVDYLVIERHHWALWLWWPPRRAALV